MTRVPFVGVTPRIAAVAKVELMPPVGIGLPSALTNALLEASRIPGSNVFV